MALEKPSLRTRKSGRDFLYTIDDGREVCFFTVSPVKLTGSPKKRYTTN
jgi:hypothetical protein